MAACGCTVTSGRGDQWYTWSAPIARDCWRTVCCSACLPIGFSTSRFVIRVLRRGAKRGIGILVGRCCRRRTRRLWWDRSRLRSRTADSSTRRTAREKNENYGRTTTTTTATTTTDGQCCTRKLWLLFSRSSRCCVSRAVLRVRRFAFSVTPPTPSHQPRAPHVHPPAHSRTRVVRRQQRRTR